jgi:hypothetical protein
MIIEFHCCGYTACVISSYLPEVDGIDERVNTNTDNLLGYTPES